MKKRVIVKGENGAILTGCFRRNFPQAANKSTISPGRNIGMNRRRAGGHADLFIPATLPGRPLLTKGNKLRRFMGAITYSFDIRTRNHEREHQ